jgi:hypothetical protein
MAMWVPYEFPDVDWWGTVELKMAHFNHSSGRVVRGLLDSSIALSGIRYSRVQEKRDIQNKVYCARILNNWVRSPCEKDIEMEVIPDEEFPTRVKRAYLTKDEHFVLSEHADESFFADSCYENWCSEENLDFLDVDVIIGYNDWRKFQFTAPDVHLLNPGFAIKWTVMGTILTIYKEPYEIDEFNRLQRESENCVQQGRIKVFYFFLNIGV